MESGNSVGWSIDDGLYWIDFNHSKVTLDDGLEVLVHIGINTVSLNGTGFQTKHKVGDKIHAGELLATVNLKLLEEKELPKFTVVLITDMDAVKAIHRRAGTAEAGKTAALTYEK